MTFEDGRRALLLADAALESRRTGAVVRVLVESTDGEDTWITTGVDANVIEASWMALVDSLVWGLLHVHPAAGPDPEI